MEKKMKQSEVRRIRSGGEKKGYSAVIWTAFLALLLLAGSILAFAESCVTTPVGVPVLLAAGLCGMACCGLTQKKTAYRIAGLAWLLPLVFLLLTAGMGNGIRGGLDWINAQIASWNALHEGGIALFDITASWGDSVVFHLFFSAVIGELSWLFASKKRITGCCLTLLFWSAMMIAEAAFLPVACGLLLVGTLAICLSEQHLPGKTAIVWTTAAAVLLLGMGILTEGGHWSSVDAFRETVKTGIHDIRYGKSMLPEGEFTKADRLHKGTDVALSVQEEQVKTLYLKAFVGGTYDRNEGRWISLPASFYAGDYTGILNWLEKRGFDPLYQPAQYYALCSEKQELNAVTVTIGKTSREFAYAPATLSRIRAGKAKNRKDETTVSRGLTGGTAYTFEELSGSRPAELTVTEDWVSAPESEAQQAYCETEKVYRNFVYDVYTQTNSSLYASVEDMFWSDYETENDGIYSALGHIRDVLKREIQYTETPDAVPDGEDPLSYALFTAKSGNAMLYASAAVLAFRVHGIPARYVEGYYVPSETVGNSDSGTAEVTGEQAHAWVEVYFDGIGWLPVDVTPGYYYDAVSLRQMVSTPDTVQQSAALANSGSDALEHAGGESMDAASLLDSFVIVKNAVMLVLGGVAIVLLLLMVMICLTEGSRMVLNLMETGRYRQADEHTQTGILQKWIFCALSCRDIYAQTGWEAEKTEEQIIACCPDIKQGEYIKVNHLLEKSVYGRMTLEPFEKRTVVNFLHKIISYTGKEKLKVRIKLRYIVLYERIRTDRSDKKKEKVKKQGRSYRQKTRGYDKIST